MEFNSDYPTTSRRAYSQHTEMQTNSHSTFEDVNSVSLQYNEFPEEPQSMLFSSSNYGHSNDSPRDSPVANGLTYLGNFSDECFYTTQDSPCKYDQSSEGLPLQNPASLYPEPPVYEELAPIQSNEYDPTAIPSLPAYHTLPRYQDEGFETDFDSVNITPYMTIQEDMCGDDSRGATSNELPWDLVNLDDLQTDFGSSSYSTLLDTNVQPEPSPVSSNSRSESNGNESMSDIPEEKIREWLKEVKVENCNRTRGPRSHEFLLRMLRDPTANPSLIAWDNSEEGIFRLIKKNLISKIWGQRKPSNKKDGISYDNFARNLRYHYRTKTLLPVSERHLVYKFGSKIMEKIQKNEDV